MLTPESFPPIDPMLKPEDFLISPPHLVSR